MKKMLLTWFRTPLKRIFFLFLMLPAEMVWSQKKTENIVIITMDGLRWQEIFKGVDPVLMNDSVFTRDPEDIGKKFWSNNPQESRRKLFPFLWGTLAEQGQLYGNRETGSRVSVSNPYWFSYPGYNEIFTGYADTAVNSNDKIPNPNINVLEFLNGQKEFHGRVAAFTTWDVFPYILNAPHSGVYVNADVDSLPFPSPAFRLLNDMQFLAAQPLGVRPDIITYLAAREYATTYQPRILYLAFDETDDYAHGGQYDQYLKSAHAQDAMMADLWKTLQSIPQYRNNTTFLITCDHGRGDKVKKQWTSHGSRIEGANETWMAFLGRGITPRGEISKGPALYQAQLAQTIAKLLGKDFRTNHPVAKGLDEIIEK